MKPASSGRLDLVQESLHDPFLVYPARGQASRATRPRLRLEALEDRYVPSTAFLATDLVSDQPGVAAVTDPTLVNAWGISLSPNGGAFWVSSNGQQLSELYTGDVKGSPIGQPFKVAIPGGSPTGQVFNGTGSTTDFVVTDGTKSGPAAFLFATETAPSPPGTPASAWRREPPAPRRLPRRRLTAADGAVYKGLALGKVGTSNFLFAPTSTTARSTSSTASSTRVALGANGFESFTDPTCPGGYAPFGHRPAQRTSSTSATPSRTPTPTTTSHGKGHGFIDVVRDETATSTGGWCRAAS